MKHLTASQKIAILEHRIAKLEKQAMFNKIKSLFSRLKPLKQAGSALRSLEMSPKDLIRKQGKVSKTKMYKQLERGLQGKSHEQKIKTLSGILINRDSPEVLESKYGIKYLGSGKQASLTMALGMPTLQEFLILLGLCVGGLLITTCSAYLLDALEDLMARIDKRFIGEDFLSHFAGSWLSLVLKVLYYPLKGIHTIAEFATSLIGEVIS